jgi:hypothetical protein
MKMNEKILRTAKNIDVAVRFLGDRIDVLDEVLQKLNQCELIDEVIELDRIKEDFNALWELFNNLSTELNETINEELKVKNEK